MLAWVSRGLRTPARKALLADAVTPATYGRAFGFERAMDTTGAIAAPLLVLILFNVGLTHRTLILLSAIPAMLAVLAILFLVRERTDRSHPHRVETGVEGEPFGLCAAFGGGHRAAV